VPSGPFLAGKKKHWGEEGPGKKPGLKENKKTGPWAAKKGQHKDRTPPVKEDHTAQGVARGRGREVTRPMGAERAPRPKKR